MMAKSPALQDQTANVILDHAARVLAEQRDAASLADIAQAAGVARSTLYRYFPNREALLNALSQRAMQELHGRIKEAELDILPVPEALARLTRGFIATGAKYVALAYLTPKPTDTTTDQVNDPVLDLLQRGINDGSLRNDLPATALLDIYGDVLQGAITRTAQHQQGVEPTSAAILTIFLNGALA